MKRSSIRSAHASLPKGIALGRYLPRLLYALVNKPANQLSLFHAGFLTNLRQGFHLKSISQIVVRFMTPNMP
jgi:hypothetical protein